MKKVFLMLLWCSIVGGTFIACCDNEEPEIEQEDKKETKAKINGVWKDGNETMILGDDGSFLTYYGNSQYDSGSQYREGVYSFDENTNTLVVNITAVPNHNSAYKQTYLVQTLTETTLVLLYTDGNVKGYYTRQTSNDKGQDEENYTNRTFQVNGVSFTMIGVKGGTFTMGATSEQIYTDNDEKPAHKVTLDSYYIGETEVTQELYMAVMQTNPSSDLNKGSQKPVDFVSWYDCQNFISKLNQLTGENFRLPTEAQWEFAARGGVESQGYIYSGSNDFNEVAWCEENSNGMTHIVKSKRPNELGIYDMSGNVDEWCSDWYGLYSPEHQINPTGPSYGEYKVLRSSAGGSSDMEGIWCRVTARTYFSPSTPGDGVGFGFRLAL